MGQLQLLRGQDGFFRVQGEDVADIRFQLQFVGQRQNHALHDLLAKRHHDQTPGLDFPPQFRWDRVRKTLVNRRHVDADIREFCFQVGGLGVHQGITIIRYSAEKDKPAWATSGGMT